MGSGATPQKIFDSIMEGREKMEWYLGIDIGASSGRHILGWLEDGKLCLEEIYRFENGAKEKNGRLCWEMDRLFSEILAGIRRCGELGKAPKTVSIDTWGVDFALLDEDGNLLGDTVAYRDSRTQGMDKKAGERISSQELYEKTGIQKQIFNTLYQLLAVKEQEPEHFKKAEHFLMVPDYLQYLLTGMRKNEYTNASTTQLLNAQTRDWDYDLLERMGIPQKWFQKPEQPGTIVGEFLPEIAEKVGFSAKVVLSPSHDTASAVLAVPVPGSIYISSGTWSLMGAELKAPNCTEESRRCNFTNEGGYGGTIRWLKNIMGLWMLQSLRRELPVKKSFDEICQLAQQAAAQGEIPQVDVNDESFLSPKSMTQAVDEWCRSHGQPVPKNERERFACVYQSLAACYRDTAKEMEEVSGGEFNCINLVGGGSQDEYLNQLTANATGKTVYAGPTEATAIGNILCQMMADGVLSSVEEARQTVKESFPIHTFTPQG